MPPNSKPSKGFVASATCQYEVEALSACFVRAEPNLEARPLTRKGRGERVRCCEASFDGWVRLADEVGWMLTDMRGTNGEGRVMRPVGGSPKLKVDGYFPQGLCCLEVVFRQAVVRETPDRQAGILGSRRKGELVFAKSQTFDGWVRLHGEDGWMLVETQEYGELLRPKRDEALDAWALADLWAAARRRTVLLKEADSKVFKDAEVSAQLMARMDYEHHVETGNVEALLDDGLLEKDDLDRPKAWIRQRLFANTLRRMALEEAPLKDLLKGFSLSSRPRPLEEQTPNDKLPAPKPSNDVYTPNSAGMVTFMHNGELFLRGPDGVVYDTDSQQPIGMWNEDLQEIEAGGQEVMVLQHGDQQFLVAPNGIVIDPQTQQPVGTFNPETQELQLIPPGMDPEDLFMQHADNDILGGCGSDGDDLDVHGWLERAEEHAAAHRYREAASAYGRALADCERSRAVELDVECEILRGRAACWSKIGDFKSLLVDAERLLEYDSSDKEALEWKRVAQSNKGARRPAYRA